MEKWKIEFYRLFSYILLTVGGVLLAGYFILDAAAELPEMSTLRVLLRIIMVASSIIMSISGFAVIYYSIQLYGTQDDLVELYAGVVKDCPEFYEKMSPMIVRTFRETMERTPTEEETNKLFAEAVFAWAKKQKEAEDGN